MRADHANPRSLRDPPGESRSVCTSRDRQLAKDAPDEEAATVLTHVLASGRDAGEWEVESARH